MLTAATGATLRELIDRMGSSTARAALIYQHGSHARQHEIADALGQVVRQQMTDPPRQTRSSAASPRARGGHGVARKPHEDRHRISPQGPDLGFLLRPEQDSNLRPTA